MQLTTRTNKRLYNTAVRLKNGITPQENGNIGLADSVNLEYNGGCVSRRARKPVQLLNQMPDQVFPIGEKLYYRYGNLLRAVVPTAEGLAFSGEEHQLSAACSGQKRSIIHYNNCLYIFPDDIQIHENSQTHSFAPQNTAAEKFPFTNGKTLFYPLSTPGSNACEDVDLLTLGASLHFSWAVGDFTVIKREEVYAVVEQGDNFVGTRITLNAAVPGYNQIPAAATATLRTPFRHAISTTFYGGANVNYFVSDNHLQLSQASFSQKYQDSFKNYFCPGQLVTLSGTGRQAVDGQAVILAVEDERLTLDRHYDFISFGGSGFTIKAQIPHANLALMNDERCIIADSDSSSIWISCRKDPARFGVHPQLRTDGCRLTVTGVSDFSALCESGGEVYFFTAEKAFRIYGSSALDYQAAALPCSGVTVDYGGSVCGMENNLFYCNGQEIVKYRVGGSQAISAGILTAPKVTQAVAYAGKYYCLTGGRLYIYQLSSGQWWSESAAQLKKLFTYEGQLYLMGAEAVYVTSGGHAAIDWQLTTQPIYDNLYGGRVSPVRVRILLSSHNGCDLKLLLNNCEKRMKLQRTVKGREFITVKLGGHSAEEFQLTLSGRGDITLHAMNIYYRRNRDAHTAGYITYQS